MNYSTKVLPILRKTRSMLWPHFGKAKIIKQKSSSAVTIVTQLDKDIETFVIKALKKVYPDIPFVGEECGGNRTAERFWLMDPIDGTQHFVRGLPFCTVMLALIEKGEVVFSAIYDFVGNKMYHAQKGKGAYCDNKKIKVSNRPLNQSYICWEAHLDNPENISTFNRLRDETVLLKTISAGWEFAMVACGKLDGRICFAPFGNDYDYAPGALLVLEAGGMVANLGTNKYSYANTNFIAANPTVFSQLTTGQSAIFPIHQ